MNSKKLLTGLGIAGGVLGVIGGVLGAYQTVDQIKNGVKLRDDQLLSLSNSISNQVTSNIITNYSAFADELIKKAKEETQTHYAN